MDGVGSIQRHDGVGSIQRHSILIASPSAVRMFGFQCPDIVLTKVRRTLMKWLRVLQSIPHSSTADGTKTFGMKDRTQTQLQTPHLETNKEDLIIYVSYNTN